MIDPKRVKFVTGNFYFLQGLRAIPLGLLFLACAADVFRMDWEAPVGTFFLIRTAASLGAIFIMAAAIFLIQMAYIRVYGMVQPKARLMLAIVIILAGALPVVAVLRFASILELYILKPGLPFSLTGMVLALLLALIWLTQVRFRLHYGLMGMAVAVVSLLPLAGIGDAGTILEMPSTGFYLTAGIVLVLGGLIDHGILASTLKPVPAPDPAQAKVEV